MKAFNSRFTLSSLSLALLLASTAAQAVDDNPAATATITMGDAASGTASPSGQRSAR